MELRQEQTTAPPENSETPWKWIPLEQPAMPYDISWMQFFDTTNLEDNCLFKVLLKDLDSQPLEAMYFGKLLKVANYLLKEKFKEDTQPLVEDENLDHKSQQLEPSEYKDILKQSHEILYEEYKKKYEVCQLLDFSNLTLESSNACYSYRSPLIKLGTIVLKITKPGNIETGAKPEAVVGKENVNTGVATRGVPQYNFSMFSDLPAKGTSRRGSLFRLFDPLYERNVDLNDAIEDKMKIEQELNQLKLYKNQLQQERASLKLELHQKDEVILKAQGEAQKKNNQFKQEIKVLQDKLSTLSEVETNDEVQLLHQQIETHKQTESNLNGTIVELKDKIVAFENIMREYEDMIGKIVPEKLKIEHDTAKRHLATLEIAFADVHTANKNGSIQQALDQKTKESTELAQLCDEMAGPAP